MTLFRLPLNSLTRVRRGDILLNKGSGHSYIIDMTLSDGTLVGVRTIEITNPQEWELLVEPSDPRKDMP